MALANFFDRSLLSAVQVLQGSNPAELRARLEAHIVELAFDGLAAGAAEGRAGLDLAVRLLARLYPTIRLTPLDKGAEALAGELITLALSINHDLETAPAGESTVRLIFGGSPAREGPPTIYGGSEGWLAKVSTRGPVGVGGTALPFGAGAAACLGAANVFRSIFADLLPASAGLDADARLSLLDFSTGAAATQGDDAPDVDLGLTHLAGLGAIGNGVIWALARMPHLTGALHLVDHEVVDLSNLQRYVLARQSDVGRVKVEIAREALLAGRTSLVPVPFHQRWAEYIAGQGHRPMARVVTALDTAKDRIAVQASLPARILNAWTQAGDLGVSQHGFLGDEACLACLYLPQGAVSNEDEVIARALALPLEQPVLLDLRERLVNGQAVGETFVRDAAARLGLEPASLLGFSGEPLRQFYAKAVCGAQVIQPQAGRGPVEVPLAFQSAMAGVMLAANLVAEAGGLRASPLKTTTVLDMMRPLGRRLGIRVLKPAPTAAANCICQDPDFIAAYRRKHDKPENKRRPRRRG
ncbi:E2 ligase fold family C protein [Rubellimicrobium roseum]|uniref:THIF-type NAD/FAD binding fold domain-containing protein n=1 Tax=Rubellimicrobium roseum TaxID=687525 RepID=A0A5C4N8M1_9RHOB|nr:E2 ligase fold family C protein [Rubellimicrobium roseum]TNC65786.1 hypothetical protein FHG71_17210 [Rubellimicrobium roseum]